MVIYMDDSCLSEILDTSMHISADQIGHLQVKPVVEWSKFQDMIRLTCIQSVSLQISHKKILLWNITLKDYA